MPIWAFALLYTAAVGALFFFCFCGAGGDVCQRGISRLQNVLIKYAVKMVESIPFCGPSIVSCTKSTYVYVVHSRNPLMQILYGVLVLGGYSLYMIRYQHLVPNPYVHEIHCYLPHFIVGFTMLSFYWASTTSPGFITAESWKKFDHHEYDGFLYVKHRGCYTCKTPKVARSKHCSLCGHCVPRFDHHCPWINICVGENNYKYFVLFLFSTMFMLLYASYVLAFLIYSEMVRINIWKASYYDPEVGRRVPATLVMMLQYMFFKYYDLCGLFLLCFVMGIVMFFFLGYHIYLIIVGTTTNESAKWSEASYIYKNMQKCVDSCNKYLEQKKLDRDICPQKDLLDPEKAPSFQERLAIEFPEKRPSNLYHYGIFESFSRVLFPHRYQLGKVAIRAKIAKAKQSKAAAKKNQ